MEIKKILRYQEKWEHQQTKWFMQKVPFYDKDYLYQASEL